VISARAKFAHGWTHPEPRAVATQFSKYWFRAVIPPVLVCAAADRAAATVAPGHLRLDTDASGIPHLLAADDPAIGQAAADGDAVLEGLFAQHLDPVVALLAACSGLAPRVFWSNAGNVVAWYLDNLRTQPATAAGAARLSACWSDAERHPRFAGTNPLHMPYATPDVADAPATRRRRICCARYLSDDCGLCETCPLSRASAARSAKR
jgi:ferric iron reductase protein FhuF